MRIAINTRLLLPNKLEGIGKFTHHVLQRLVKKRPKDHFYFLFDRPYDAKFIYNSNIQARVIFPQSRHPFLWYWYFHHSIPKALKTIKADLYLSPDNYLGKIPSCPSILVTHDIAFEHQTTAIPWMAYKYYKHFMPTYNQKANHVITVSNYTKQDLIKTYHLNPNKITVCGNSTGTKITPTTTLVKKDTKKKYAEGQDYFLYIGAIHPRKNITRLIKAFEIYKDKTQSPKKLVLVGRFAWKTGKISQAYQNSPYHNDIITLGYVPDQDLSQILGSATAFIYPSLFEGFGIPLLEAMHAQVPIITSNLTSLPEVAGNAALLINPYKIEELSNAMFTISNENYLKNQLIQNGIAQAKKYSWEKTTEIISHTIDRYI